MKKTLRLLVSLLLIVVLVACNNERDVKEEEKLHKMTMMLDWYPNAVHTYLYVAKEKGYFEEEGLDVTFQFPANPTDPLTLAAAGKVTMGMYYQPDVIQAVANEGIPVKSVAAVVRSPLNHIVFRSDDPINNPKELEGKKVGYPGIPLNETIVKTIVENNGGNYEKVDMVNVEFELGSSLVTKQVDAVSGAYVNHEVPQLKSEGHDVDYINPVDHGVPNYYELVAVTSDDTWKEEKEEIEAFWRAARKGFDFMEQNSKEALQILLDQQDEANFPLNKAVETESMNILLPKMRSEAGFATQERSSWEETAKWLEENSLIEKSPNIDEIMVNIEP
ncbi:ABC transporter substrate-binding protein [Paraliobacillus sp. JSM ZJ581]|uniref:ABC transporter substrate-binding protein n=1 Tax=Paraliobacillus sp. JSM ZJ581 TaxID=3342118 RepID=UPI0035A81E36